MTENRIMLNAMFMIICVSFLSSSVDSTPQLNASFENDTSTIQKLFETEIIEGIKNYTGNLNSKINERGQTVLMLAAQNGYKDVVEWLIGKRVDIEAKDDNGYTALMLAVDNNHRKTAELLISNGANLEAENSLQSTAIIRAAMLGHREIIDLLISKGANINKKDCINETALDYAATFGHTETVELLVKRGANINCEDDFGTTPLINAAKAGKYDVVRVLLENGAENRRDQEGLTAKQWATLLSNKQMVELLEAYSRISQEACSLYSNYSVRNTEHVNSNASVDGDPIEQDNLPWMAALGFLDVVFGKFTFECAGALISDSFVLSAAQCIEGNHRPDSVRPGNAEMRFKRNKNVFRIKNMLKHPEYSTTTKQNDIALIELMETIYISNTMRPACLQRSTEDMDSNVNLTIIQWDFIVDEYQIANDSLLKTNLKTMPKSLCNSTLLVYNRGKDILTIADGISESQYCAFEPNGKSDSCVGDSGGPLLVIGNGSTPTKVVGIVSFNVAGSCGSKLPSVYTRVASFISWIESTVWPNEKIIPPKINYSV